MGDVIDLFLVVREKRARSGFRSVRNWELLRAALPLLLTPGVRRGTAHAFDGDETGRRSQRDEGDFIRFHYDLGNDFHALFLDPHMQYSCAYFPEWEASLETAQEAKLDLICRKLQLQPGERLLDIGCGWGGLVCHAALRCGVRAHGVTLSPAYFARVRSLLRDRGVFLNHAITRRAKRSRRAFARIRPEQRLVKKYVFPGSELDHIGHSVECLEASGFEVHDVEGLREHYAHTTRLWCERLTASEERATELVGRERYRLWVAYLAGVSFAFADGSLRIFQTVATRHTAKGASGMPPTRAHVYAGTETPRPIAARRWGV